jgi:hypothetical protein
MLKFLQMRDVGPAPRFEIHLTDRLNIFTGDNGLGKTFILDVAWWALTGTWASLPASPRRGGDASPLITVEFKGRPKAKRVQMVSEYDFPRQEWPRKAEGSGIPSLVVYAQIDGSFSVWDPARNLWDANDVPRTRSPNAFHFSPKDVWDGLPPREDQTSCNGLIRDWVYWQMQHTIEQIQDGVRAGKNRKHKEASQFSTLERIIRGLSSTPGEPRAYASGFTGIWANTLNR